MRVFTTILLGVLLLLAVSCGEKATETKFELAYTDFEEAQKVATDADKPLLIDFWRPGCPWCTTIDTVILIDPKAIDYFTSEMVLVKVDGWQDSAKADSTNTITNYLGADLAEKYHVSAYPSLILLDATGKEIDRVIGYCPTDTLLNTLKDYLNGIGTLDDLLAKHEATPNRDTAYLIADKYGYRGDSEEAKVWYQKVIDGGDPMDSTTYQCRVELANIERRDGNFELSIQAFTDLEKDFHGTEHAADAGIWRAWVIMKSADTAAAIAAFEDFLKQYPDSEECEFATKSIRKLKGLEEEKPATE